MAQNDFLKRYIDAGLEFGALTQGKAEALVKDLVKAGELQADQAREAVSDLIDRSRKTSERLLETIHQEVRSQITGMGLASKGDLDRLESKIGGLFSSAGGSAKRTAKKATAKASTAKRATAKKATAKKTAAKKTTAKKTTAKKAATRKAPAKRAPASKATAKKQA
ncbi:MAG: hypothetical protein ABWZ76_00275 [Acidimicrobiales bacterium]